MGIGVRVPSLRRVSFDNLLLCKLGGLGFDFRVTTHASWDISHDQLGLRAAMDTRRHLYPTFPLRVMSEFSGVVPDGQYNLSISK